MRSAGVFDEYDTCDCYADQGPDDCPHDYFIDQSNFTCAGLACSDANGGPLAGPPTSHTCALSFDDVSYGDRSVQTGLLSHGVVPVSIHLYFPYTAIFEEVQVDIRNVNGSWYSAGYVPQSWTCIDDGFEGVVPYVIEFDWNCLNVPFKIDAVRTSSTSQV